jgi:hypothetical protein
MDLISILSKFRACLVYAACSPYQIIGHTKSSCPLFGFLPNFWLPMGLFFEMGAKALPYSI